jgi:hypothetical protein
MFDEKGITARDGEGETRAALWRASTVSEGDGGEAGVSQPGR